MHRSSGSSEHPLRVLVVDDHVDTANGLSQFLRLVGYDARAAYDGGNAAGVGPSFLPDVVLMDLGMPGLDGFETARRIRRTDWGRDVRLLALTGRGEDACVREAEAAGFDGHLVKPVDLDVLLGLLT